MRDCEVTDAGCQVIEDIVKVNDTIEEMDLPENTKSSNNYKITIDEYTETVEITKTTLNIVRYYHGEATHADEVHEECFVQLLCLGDDAQRCTFFWNPPIRTLQLLARGMMKIILSHQS